MAHGDIAISAVPPHVVGDAGGDALVSGLGEVEQGPAAEHIDAGDDGGVEVGVEGIAEGGDEESLAVRTLLVDIPIDLWSPL